MKKFKVIIDTDPGIDDAVALSFVLSQPNIFDVKLMSTISGNVSIEKVTLNTLLLLKMFNRKDIPVVMGAKQPLKRKPIYADEIHGEFGLGGYKGDYSKFNLSKIKSNVAEQLYKTIKANPNEITLISLGPKTNIANLLTKYPDCAKLIKRHICMGGSAKGTGNITKYGEFNCWVDPEAYDIVLKYNIPTEILPIEIGEKLIFKNNTVKKVASVNKVGEFFGEMFSEYKNEAGEISVQNHDPATIIYALNPSIFKSFKCDITTDVGQKYRGRTIVTKNNKSNISIIYDASISKYQTYFLSVLKKIGK